MEVDLNDKAFFAQNGFAFRSFLGEGTYGSILLVYSYQYQQCFALKKIPTNAFQQVEIESLTVLNNNNIVRLYQYYFFNDFVYLLLEYCPYSVDKIMEEKKIFHPHDCLTHAYGLLQALNYCHKRNIAHGDIKPSNFLIDSFGRIKITDFGLAMIRKPNELCDKYSGCFIFMAPEIFAMRPYDPLKADIWGFGVSLYMMATGKCPWKGGTRSAVFQCITHAEYDAKIIPSPEIYDLIRKSIIVNPDERYTAEQLLSSPVFFQFHNTSSKKRSSGIIIPAFNNSRRLRGRHVYASLKSSIF